MRTTYTLSLFFAAAGLFAQPTIQQFTFVPGTTILMDGTFPITSEGAAGANVTWDHSGLPFSSDLYTYVAQAIGTVTGADQFPGANAVFAVELTQGFTAYFFFSYSGGFIDHGEIITGGASDLYMPYSDPQTYCTTPLAFGGSGSDTYASSNSIAGFNSTTTGTISWNVDAYGTLVLPNASYTDVLRVRTMESETTSIDIGGTLITTDSQEEKWHWFKAGYTLPLLTYSILTDQSGTEPGAAVALVSMTGAIGLNEESLPALNVQPNPTSGTCMINFPGAVDPQVRLLNAAGQVVLQERLKGADPKYALDLSGEAPGVYVIEARSLNGMQRTRVIRQ